MGILRSFSLDGRRIPTHPRRRTSRHHPARGPSVPRLQVERLDERVLPSTYLTLPGPGSYTIQVGPTVQVMQGAQLIGSYPRSNGQIQIVGTAGAETVSVRLEAGSPTVVALDGGGGTDTLLVQDSSLDDQIYLGPGTGLFISSDYTLDAHNFRQVRATSGGGADGVILNGSSGSDLFVTTAAYASAAGPGLDDR